MDTNGHGFACACGLSQKVTKITKKNLNPQAHPEEKKMLVEFDRYASSWAGFSRVGSAKLKAHGPKVRSLEVWLTLDESV